MRAQRRRFVVEVKRGTSRASFLSTDAAADKFSSAEDVLFGPKDKAALEQPVVAAPNASASAGRILRDLQEPPPPPVSEMPPPARRGRKPGSKNKPKPVLAALPPIADRPARADVHAQHHAGPGVSPEPFAAPAQAEPQRSGEGSPKRRTRLRDRSAIIRRYVLGTEPAPGQSGWTRSLRSRRSPGA